MAVLTVYRNGVKGGVPPAPSDHDRAKRGACTGWSSKSARSNLEFLRSVDIEGLSGLGHSFTLTVGDCPPSAAAWAAMRKAWAMRLVRGGLVRLHWVTEWQRRAVPHLHGVAFFEYPQSDAEFASQVRLLTCAWLEVVAEYRAEQGAQHIQPIYDALGWLKYLAKHAARGAEHYQRAVGSIPPGWDKKTGRMWGKAGDWPTVEAVRLDLSSAAFWILRRWIQRYRLSDARGEPCEAVRRRRISSARGMLQARSLALGEIRGFSEWIPESTLLRMCDFVYSAGHGIQS